MIYWLTSAFMAATLIFLVHRTYVKEKDWKSGVFGDKKDKK